jgi:hypothetical protein
MPLITPPSNVSTPGTHALVIGVSAYEHFEDGNAPTPNGRASDMEQLTAAAHSASHFAAWLLTDYRCSRAPLNSLRVLLSPSPDETVNPTIANALAAQGMTATTYAATRANVVTDLRAFINDCGSNTQNVVIVYVAGHGVQLTKHGAILLLNDYGASNHLTMLEGAIDMAGVHAGLNHPHTAQTQFWFVDSCRQTSPVAKYFEKLEGALKLDLPLGTAEISPMFLAATSGNAAYARPGGQTLFNEALMWALDGKVAVGPDAQFTDWHIPVTELIKYLPDKVKALAMAEGVEQSVDITGKIHEAVFHECVFPPQVELTIDLQPDIAYPHYSGQLQLNGNQTIINNYVNWPLTQHVVAGLYLLDLQAQAPYANYREILQLKPPKKSVNVRVST